MIMIRLKENKNNICDNKVMCQHKCCQPGNVLWVVCANLPATKQNINKDGKQINFIQSHPDIKKWLQNIHDQLVD